MIQRTNSKEEQAELLIRIAEQFQNENDGTCPTVAELADAAETSSWTVYHNPIVMDWLRSHNANLKVSSKKNAVKRRKRRQTKKKDAVDTINVNGVAVYQWMYHEELVVRNAEMEKCLSTPVRTIVKVYAKENADCGMQISMQELWDENPGCARTGNPIFPTYVYKEAAFRAIAESNQLRDTQKEELQNFIRGYFHAGEKEVPEENMGMPKVQEAAPVNTPECASVNLTPLLECFSAGIHEVAQEIRASREVSNALYSEFTQQNTMLTQAITLLSKSMVKQEKILEQMQMRLEGLTEKIEHVETDQLMTATAKVLLQDGGISDAEKNAIFMSKKRSEATRQTDAVLTDEIASTVDVETNHQSEAKQSDAATSATEGADDAESGNESLPEDSGQAKASAIAVPEPLVLEPPASEVPAFMNFSAYRNELNAVLAEYHMLDVKEQERRAVFGKAYTHMRNRYGIVWEQVGKDYIQENGEKAKSTMKLAYFLEMTTPSCRGLLKACLQTVLSENKSVMEHAAFHVKELSAIDETIERIANRNNMDPQRLHEAYVAMLQADSTMHWRRISTAYREKFRLASGYVLDPIKVAGSTDKAKKRAVLLFNQFVDKQLEAIG